MAACLCIWVSSFRVPLYLAPLKNQSPIPYVAISKMHDQYSRHLCLGRNPRLELPRDAIAIAAENDLVAYIFAYSVKRSLQSKKKSKYLQRRLGMRGIIRIWGISKVNQYKCIRTVSGKVERFRFIMFQHKTHGTGELIHSGVSCMELYEVGLNRFRYYNDCAIVDMKSVGCLVVQCGRPI